MQFLGDIAGILEIIAVAIGFVVLHWATKESSRHLKLAAGILIVGGVLSGACTTYYWFKYHGQGAFEAPAPIGAMHGHMGKGTMPMHQGR